MAEADWVDVGDEVALRATPLAEVTARGRALALTCVDGRFAALHGACNHAGGPLGQGRLDGAYVVCPWHGWKFHATTGVGEPGYEADAVPAYPVKVEGGRVFVDLAGGSPRRRAPHPPHPLARPVERGPGPVRVVGVSTTNMSRRVPRFSTSEALLETALDHARDTLGAETRLIRLRDLSFKACEGYYSTAAAACTWPCTITQFDPKDQLDRVYEAFVHWADVILVATPIRWGAPSSLYARMAERLNCVQNQETIAGKVLMQRKVAAFVVTGGQDNVLAVAGQMMAFFGELGCQLPAFPFVAHSRGWSAEDMEHNVREVQASEALRDGARALADRAVTLARTLLAAAEVAPFAPGGRKGNAADAAPP